MYKVIVVGTDGSARAGIAVREALALAKSDGATLHAVHVWRKVTLGGEHVDPARVAAANATIHDEGERICAQVAADATRRGRLDADSQCRWGSCRRPSHRRRNYRFRSLGDRQPGNDWDQAVCAWKRAQQGVTPLSLQPADRQHRSRLNPPGQGRRYFDRKVVEGKTTKEALRTLKRQISNVVYRQLVIDSSK